jgi:alkylation response protein AidB-like acyl-CoA dehydrogenase
VGFTNQYAAANYIFDDSPKPSDLCSYPLRKCSSGNLFGGNEPARTWFLAMKPIARDFGPVALPPTDPRYVNGAAGSEIPSVTGLKLDAAIKRVRDAGFQVPDLPTPVNSYLSKGAVAGTTPKGKTIPGSIVTINTSNGIAPPQVYYPPAPPPAAPPPPEAPPPPPDVNVINIPGLPPTACRWVPATRPARSPSATATRHRRPPPPPDPDRRPSQQPTAATAALGDDQQQQRGSSRGTARRFGGSTMRLTLSDADAAFRDDLREFFTTQVPADVRARARAVNPTARRRRHRAADLEQARNGSPELAGGVGWQDWSPLQRQIWSDELRLACVPEPLAFNASMVSPVIAAFGSRGSRSGSCRDRQPRHLVVSGLLRPEAGSDLAASHHRGPRRRFLRDQRAEDVDHVGPVRDRIFVLARTNPDAPKKQAGISFLLAEMSTPGSPCARSVDRRRIRGQRGLLRRRPRPRRSTGRRGEQRLDLRQVPAEQRAHRHRQDRHDEGVAVAGQGTAANTPTEQGTLLDDPLFAARVAEAENELLALELTQLRVSGSEGSGPDGKPNPASSILKLKGSQLQQAVTELLVDVAGPDALPVDAGADIGSPPWAQLAAPKYLNYRKTSIYGGTNEIQRNIIASTILGL